MKYYIFDEFGRIQGRSNTQKTALKKARRLLKKRGVSYSILRVTNIKTGRVVKILRK